METSRVWFYAGVALVILIVGLMILVAEPDPDQPTNLVHLLFRH